jgi:hypothetical protein
MTPGLLPLFGNLADVGVPFGVYAAYEKDDDDDRHRVPALAAGEYAELGVGLDADTDDTSALGESIERRPAENDDDRLCDRICRSLGVVGGFSVAVMSMLPPPSTDRLRSPARSAFSVCACAGVGSAPGTGVSTIVPVSCTYEYRISSVLLGGKVEANAVRGWTCRELEEG